uniref:Uncharacterized protein n=1 Tax=Arion vulgaris TaxID=1028688 RepID=A0A0B6ZJV4_9EUPU
MEQFMYLGSIITLKGGTHEDIIKACFGKARAAFERNESNWKSCIYSNKTNLRLYILIVNGLKIEVTGKEHHCRHMGKLNIELVQLDARCWRYCERDRSTYWHVWSPMKIFQTEPETDK